MREPDLRNASAALWRWFESQDICQNSAVLLMGDMIVETLHSIESSKPLVANAIRLQIIHLLSNDLGE